MKKSKKVFSCDVDNNYFIRVCVRVSALLEDSGDIVIESKEIEKKSKK